MLLRCYGQSWYKYHTHIGVRVLICKDVHDRVMDGAVDLTRIRDGLRPTCQ